MSSLDGVGRRCVDIFTLQSGSSGFSDGHGLIALDRVVEWVSASPPETAVRLHNECFFTVREVPNSASGISVIEVRSPWYLPVDVASKTVQEVITMAQEDDNSMLRWVEFLFCNRARRLRFVVEGEHRQPGGRRPRCV